MKTEKKYSETRELSPLFSASRDLLFFKSLYALFHILFFGGLAGALIYFLF